MRVEPYLFFNGRCDEAIALYQGAFGASLLARMLYKEAPDTPPVPLPPGWGDKVLHASLRIGETTVMASDGLTTDPPRFEGFSLSVEMPDEQAARRAFDALAPDGQVQMPIGPTFFSPCFGMVVDRFGVSWMITIPNPT